MESFILMLGTMNYQLRGDKLRTKRPEFTAFLNCKVSANVRAKIENFAIEQNLSLGEATRHFLSLGIQQQEMGS